MVQRITYRRRLAYNTRSNAVRAVRTPGNKVIAHYKAKKANGPKCADTGVQLYGIPALRPFQYKNLEKRKRTVSRAYGGVLSAGAVKTRIIGAFLAEEKRILKVLQKKKEKEAKIAAKKAAVAKKATGAKKAPVKKAANKKVVKK